MADTAQDPMSLGGRETITPMLDLEDGFVHVDGEIHVLNPDTNILNLDENREVSPGADMDVNLEIPTTNTDSNEEDADIEVNFSVLSDQMMNYYMINSYQNYLIFLG